MSAQGGQKTRWRPPWKVVKHVVLRNVSDKNVLLHLPTGHQRIEKGRRLLVTPEIAHLPEVQHYIQQGVLVIETDKQH